VDIKGIAPLVIAVVVVVAASASVATPVAVDSIDVDPDSPLYALERLGERIKGVSDVSAMKERFMEFSKMCDKGKGADFQNIYNEFSSTYEKLMQKLPDAEKAKILEWAAQQEARMVKNRIQLSKQVAIELKKSLKGTPDEAVLDNIIQELNACTREVENRLAEVKGRLELLKQKVQDIKESRPGIHVDTKVNIAATTEVSCQTKELEIKAEAEERKSVKIEDLLKKYQEFDSKLAEIEAKLQLAPMVAGGKAAHRLVEEAKKHRNMSENALNENRLGAAAGLLHAAEELLERAEMILDHAVEWEKEHASQWRAYENAWGKIEEKLKEWGKVGLENLRALLARQVEIQKRFAEVEEEYQEKETEAEEGLRKGCSDTLSYVQKAVSDWAARKEEFRSKVEPMGGICVMAPWRIPVSGTIDAQGNLTISFSLSTSNVITVDWGQITHERSISGNITAVVAEGKVKGNLSANGTGKIASKYSTFSKNISLTAAVEGTISDSVIECDVHGTGTGSVSFSFSLTTSIEWTHTVTFDVEGKLVGEVSNGTFNGNLYLKIVNVHTAGITITKEPITQPLENKGIENQGGRLGGILG
jgi:hypothetical protein